MFFVCYIFRKNPLNSLENQKKNNNTLIWNFRLKRQKKKVDSISVSFSFLVKIDVTTLELRL